MYRYSKNVFYNGLCYERYNIYFTDSCGSQSPVPSDQPGPLSRSVKLRVSKTCN